MGKYDPLQRHLETLDHDSWQAEFADIERVLAFELPFSAHRHSAWWANESSGSHSHARSWLEAGWNTRDVNLGERRVRFERAKPVTNARSGANARPAKHFSDRDLDSLGPLLDKASAILQVADHAEILRIALESLIRRAVSRELASLGGSMPDLQVPERERPGL